MMRSFGISIGLRLGANICVAHTWHSGKKNWTGRFTRSFLHQECWSLLTSCYSQFSHKADVGISRADVLGNRSKERDRKSELVLRSTYQIFEWDRNNSDRNFYNVVRYVHIPLVPWMQERSEAERRAIWPCLNVATWRRELSDRAIQQIR